jgi:hypothetical protein
VVAQFAEEPEGVVEVEAEGPHDGGGEVVEGLAALDLDVPVHLGFQPDPENVGAHVGLAARLRRALPHDA